MPPGSSTVPGTAACGVDVCCRRQRWRLPFDSCVGGSSSIDDDDDQMRVHVNKCAAAQHALRATAV